MRLKPVHRSQRLKFKTDNHKNVDVLARFARLKNGLFHPTLNGPFNPTLTSSIYRGFHTYSSFTGNPKYIWEQIRNNYSEVERDLNRKIEIADSLAKYSSETINRRMIYIQVLISAMTFILVIFPEKARSLANLIKCILGLLPVN